ncbi:MAG TPA: magnesium and cobalt transport protein CorA, partial [Marinilabiliaceae bacterium]|nr:magnesium and cobalt transport protein CorA [Marinilabiliaceae bacterium]
GVYGMNFKYMPELEWKYGYLGIWGLIILTFLVMVIFLRRKKWF